MSKNYKGFDLTGFTWNIQRAKKVIDELQLNSKKTLFEEDRYDYFINPCVVYYRGIDVEAKEGDCLILSDENTRVFVEKPLDLGKLKHLGGCYVDKKGYTYMAEGKATYFKELFIRRLTKNSEQFYTAKLSLNQQKKMGFKRIKS